MSKNINSKHTFYNVELPKSWEIRTVDSIKAKEKYSCAAGPFGSSISAKFFVDQGIPVIRGCNLSLGKESFIAKDFVFITEDKAKSFLGQQVKAGDLVFTCWGTLGQVGLIPANGQYEKYVISNKQLKLRPNFDICNSKYLYYYFSLPQMVQYINNIAIGSAVPGINLGLLKKIKVVLPPIEIQNKITAILSAYDDLIENNKRRIALLEKMAEEIYREWFVRFRFPGYQQAKFEKGIPEGWKIDKAEHFFCYVRGKSYRSHEISDNPEIGKPFINLKSFYRGGGYREDGLKYYSGSFRKEQIVKAGDVVMAVTDMTQNREVIGRVALIPNLENKDAVMSLDVIKLVSKDISNTYLYSYLKYSGFGNFIKEFANGSNVLHLKPDLVTTQKIIMPSKILREKFEKIVNPIYQQINKLSLLNKKLELTRNKLLPRLISGKLSVENLDIQFPPSML